MPFTSRQETCPWVVSFSSLKVVIVQTYRAKDRNFADDLRSQMQDTRTFPALRRCKGKGEG